MWNSLSICMTIILISAVKSFYKNIYNKLIFFKNLLNYIYVFDKLYKVIYDTPNWSYPSVNQLLIKPFPYKLLGRIIN